jgi:F0F1-type ATP synthase membrane subunit c/vacuolar-type H+-ATPase subunit K
MGMALIALGCLVAGVLASCGIAYVGERLMGRAATQRRDVRK